MGQLTMSKEDREAFLAGVHIGVLAVAVDGQAPLLTPIWYSYEPGGAVVLHTGTSSPKTAALRAAGRASLCVQTETPPYQYVVVEGSVAIEEGRDEDWRRDVAHRYLGPEMGELYMQSTSSVEDPGVFVSLVPERWKTTDYGKQWS
jgi:PPOX class probable F420-dependent enzyme